MYLWMNSHYIRFTSILDLLKVKGGLKEMLRIFVGVLLSLVLLVMLGTATFAAPPNDASRPQPPSQLGASTAPCPCEYTLFWDTALAQIMTR
jgi:hypothetical protein